MIRQFSVAPNQITVGQCVTLQWSVEGQVNNVRLLRDGVQIWGDTPLGGTYQDCPPGPGQLTYAIEASGPEAPAASSKRYRSWRSRRLSANRNHAAAPASDQQLCR